MILYHKGKSGVLLDNCNRFIYEVAIIVTFDNFLSTPLIKYFSSDKYLEVVSEIKLNKYTIMEIELYSAPLRWLLDNNYIPYKKPEKKKRILKQNKIKKDD
jgi:hypothetical protein